MKNLEIEIDSGNLKDTEPQLDIKKYGPELDEKAKEVANIYIGAKKIMNYGYQLRRVSDSFLKYYGLSVRYKKQVMSEISKRARKYIKKVQVGK